MRRRGSSTSARPGPRELQADPDGGTVRAELGLSDAIVSGLIKRGHKVERVRTNGGGYQAILLDPDTGVLHGGSEARKDGAAVGY